MNIYNKCYFIFTEVFGDMACLASDALPRLKVCFRPATMSQYTRMFKCFLCFLEKAQLSPYQMNTVILLAFMEYLHQKGLSQLNISMIW